MKTKAGEIIKQVEVGDEMVTIIRLEGGGLIGVDTSYLANEVGHVYSSVDKDTIVTGDGLTFEE